MHDHGDMQPGSEPRDEASGVYELRRPDPNLSVTPTGERQAETAHRVGPVAAAVQPHCGHAVSSIYSGREGTTHCTECEQQSRDAADDDERQCRLEYVERAEAAEARAEKAEAALAQVRATPMPDVERLARSMCIPESTVKYIVGCLHPWLSAQIEQRADSGARKALARAERIETAARAVLPLLADRDPYVAGRAHVALREALAAPGAADAPAAPADPDAALGRAIREFVDWGLVQFPQATPHTTAAHLAKEVAELQADPTDASEYADCLGLLCHGARRAGVDLVKALSDKLVVNKARKWGKPNAQGFVEHVRDGGTPPVTVEPAGPAGGS